MIGSWSHIWNCSIRACFPFAVFYDGEANASYIQICIIDPNTSPDRSGIIRIRQVARLGSLHFLNITYRHVITSIRSRPSVGFLSCSSPNIVLTDIVIIRYAYGRSVLDNFSEFLSKPQPILIMLGMIIYLVPGKE